MKKDTLNLILAFVALFSSIIAYTVNDIKKSKTYEKRIEQLELSVEKQKNELDLLKREIKEKDEENFKSCFKGEY